MSAVLDDVMGSDDDRNLHLDRVVDCGPQIDVLAQDHDRLDVRPPVRDLVDIARDPDATGTQWLARDVFAIVAREEEQAGWS